MSSSSTPTPEPETRTTATVRDEVPWYGTAPEGRGPTRTERHAWRAYFEATQMLSELLERSLKTECGMSLADYNMLLLLYEADENRLRLGELASRMVFAPSRVTYQVRTLVDRGLVERRPVACDKRGFEAVLTDQGRTAFRRAAVHHARQVDELFLEHLHDGEADVLARVFSRVGRTLEKRC